MPSLVMAQDSVPRCRVVVLGDPGVGKTALTVRLLTKRFIGEYCPTLENIYEYQARVGLNNVRLQILDTAGQVGIENTDSYLTWGDAFVLVYSVTDRTSFNRIATLQKYIEEGRKCFECTSFVIIGNKNDLEHERKVSHHEGALLARNLQVPFHELSAADGRHVLHIAETFRELYQSFLRLKQIACSNHSDKPRSRHPSVLFRRAIQKVILGTKLARHLRKSSS